MGRFDEAAAEFRALEVVKPPRGVLAAALGDLAEAAAGASQLDLALEYANRAVQAKEEARFYKQRAAILRRLERFEDAQVDLSRAQQFEKEGAR